MNLTFEEAAIAAGGKCSLKGKKISRVVIDNRKAVKNSLFFAIKGENRDGHDYAAAALKAGAAAVVCSRRVKGLPPEKAIFVKDTKAAFLAAAKYYAMKFPALKKCGVTGSNGKTTVKEMTAAILREKFKAAVLKSEKSYNNYAGVPLTLFKIRKKHRVLVLEAGMNHRGEIKGLVSGLGLDAALITNIGASHIGMTGSKRATALAKAEIFSGVKTGGYAVINAGDKYAGVLRAKARGLRVKTFGLRGKADVKAGFSAGSGELWVFDRKNRMRARLKGAYQAENAAAAAALAVLFGAGKAHVKEGLERFSMKGMLRWDEYRKNGALIIKDCYNANPDSFEAAINVLRDGRYSGIIMVTGDMLELGKYSPSSHEELGKSIAELAPEALLILGKMAAHVRRGFIKKAGKAAGAKVMVFKDKALLKKRLGVIAGKNKTVFIKGSRANRLEEVI
ncbi:MAG TPA: UDP-N-acetylmuramoyl-tripeptide--D-alanyl-D-alanine ligase [bacterium]|nr:UDP-N-acetylmuramoyl-tripeptide--D-alanyl-D-alanine ligase [bacterium]